MKMDARTILDEVVNAGRPRVQEASVRLPPRSTRYVATFSGPEPGVQVARSTGTADRDKALRLARKWEREARREREAKKAAQPDTGAFRGTAFGLSQREVAALLRVSERAVRAIERRALRKLRQHPLLRQVWREHEFGEPAIPPQVDEADVGLTKEEIEALVGLAWTPLEQRALAKLLGCVSSVR